MIGSTQKRKDCLFCAMPKETAKQIVREAKGGRISEHLFHLCEDCRGYLQGQTTYTKVRACRKCSSPVEPTRYYDCETCVPFLQEEVEDATYAA